MMHNFLANNFDELTRRCRQKVTDRPGRAATPEQLESGVPMFLRQLVKTLQIEQTDQPQDSRKISGPANGGDALSEVSISASVHGRQLLLLGFSVDQVVHDYGDLCQAITDLAFERDAPFEVDEFRTLNRCLDNAIANAVTEFSYQRDLVSEEKRKIETANRAAENNERHGFFIHELRNCVHTADLALMAAQAGNLSLSGATGGVLKRSLAGLKYLIDRSVAEVRIANVKPAAAEYFSLADFIADIKSAADLAATSRGMLFTVATVDRKLRVHGNRDLLSSAVWNLVQNAFKFSHAHSEVILNAYGVADRILIDISDHCGGLPSGLAENMFRPFTQLGKDRTGLGLGLSIAQQSVMANGGVLDVQDVPGVGCIFTVSLPRHERAGAN